MVISSKEQLIQAAEIGLRPKLFALKEERGKQYEVPIEAVSTDGRINLNGTWYSHKTFTIILKGDKMVGPRKKGGPPMSEDYIKKMFRNNTPVVSAEEQQRRDQEARLREILRG